MLKNRTKKTANLLQMSSLYSQHTESSLNKIRAKQAQQHQHNSALQIASGVDAPGKMNKSPSMNSLPPNENQSDAEIAAGEPYRNGFARQSISAKSSPTKQNLTAHLTAQNSNSNAANLNLKKAASMMSLAAANPTQSATVPSISTASSTNAVPASSRASAHRSSSNNLAGSTSTLPPKTVRQVKQKSIDSRGSNGTITVRPQEPSRARKLSNSTQNLADNNHHQQQHQNGQHHGSPTKEASRTAGNSVTAKTQKYKRRSVTEECSKQSEAETGSVPTSSTCTHIKLKDVGSHNGAEHENKSPHASAKSGKMNAVDAQAAYLSDYEKVITEFKTNIYSLELAYSQTKIEELSEMEQKQKGQLIEKFNSAVHTFINQLEMIKVKQTLAII